MFHWLSKRNKPFRGKKVFVGVSGGVDSSVVAALLLDQGYDVVGVFIRTWQPDFIECTWRDERRDAMRVCAHLNIPFVELDLEQEYKQGVADYMITEYRLGRTPNPDVMCNREVKFGGFLRWALAHGADYVATGHYARVQHPFLAGEGESRSEPGEVLLRGIDASKDQSYFLWTLTQDQLKHILFPVGHLPKSEVRKLAKKYTLPTATKKDSQGICFIGEIDMKEFLAHYIERVPGNVLNESGEVIGNHPGALFFTLGERHGFTVIQKTTDEKPYYVVAKDVTHNTLTVSQNPQPKQGSAVAKLESCVWRGTPSFRGGRGVSAQIRYHGDFKSVTLNQISPNEAEIIFDEPDYTLSAGQSVVIYDGDMCVGGGVVV